MLYVTHLCCILCEIWKIEVCAFDDNWDYKMQYPLVIKSRTWGPQRRSGPWPWWCRHPGRRHCSFPCGCSKPPTWPCPWSRGSPVYLDRTRISYGGGTVGTTPKTHLYCNRPLWPVCTSCRAPRGHCPTALCSDSSHPRPPGWIPVD